MSGDHVRARELYLATSRSTRSWVSRRWFREGYRSFVPYLGVAAAALASAEGDHPLAARMVGFRRDG